MDESNGAEILYDTLDSFPFFSNIDTDTNHEPDTDSVTGTEPTESYSVYRNQITAPGDVTADIPVTNYFPLEVEKESNPSPSREIEEVTKLEEISGVVGANAVSERAWFRSGCRFKSPMVQLHKEIIDFCNFLSPTPEEEASRTAAVEEVFEVVKYIWPHCRVEVFGSFRTGLYLPTSDVDVVILGSKVDTPQKGLYALAKALNQRNISKKTQVIAKARVPIIKFIERKSGIAFDISFDIDGGPKAADFIKNAVWRLPPLRPLCLILKVFLQQRELNEVYSGGIGSYTLLSMLIAYLQIHWRGQVLQRCKMSMEHNLGILLVNFFDFYGRRLNTTDVGISCHLAGTFFLKEDRGFVNMDRPNLLSIEDPQAPENDIGRNSFNYFKVKSAFILAHSLLTDARAIAKLGSKQSILGTIIRPDPVLLDRKGGSNGELTFDSLLPGAEAPMSQRLSNGNGDVYNFQMFDEEEPLPRGKLTVEDGSVTRQSKSRKKSKDKHKKKKDGSEEKYENGNGNGNEANGVASGDGSSKKRRRRKAFQEDDERFLASIPQRWNHS